MRHTARFLDMYKVIVVSYCIFVMGHNYIKKTYKEYLS